MGQSKSETGHVKNWTAFHELISFCNGYGANYKPSRDIHKLVHLNSLYAEGKSALSTLKDAVRIFNVAVGDRQRTYADLKLLVPRIISALESCGTTADIMADVMGINRKLTGRRATPKETPDTPTAAGEIPSDKTISVSQLSFDRQSDHFEELCKLVATVPTFLPNESDLTLDALVWKATQLEEANKKVVNLFTDVSNARIRRNAVFYNPLMGIVATAKSVKGYIRSAFGHKSPEYKQVAALEFRTIRNGK